MARKNGAATPDYTVEETLLGGKVIGGVGKLLGSESDVAFAGAAQPSPKGNIGAGQMTNEGLPVKLTDSDMALLQQLQSLPDKQAQGALREYMADNYFLRNGYVKLDGKCGSNCFDGVYLKDGQVFISEVKPLNANGSIKLSGGNVATNLDTQIDVLAGGTPAQRSAAALIRNALDNGTITRVVAGVNSSQLTIVKLPPVGKP